MDSTTIKMKVILKSTFILDIYTPYLYNYLRKITTQ